MGIGNYKQIMLVKEVSTKGVFGNWDETTETRYPVWAEVETKSNNRIYKDGQTALVDIVEFIVGFNPAFSPDVDWKIVYDGRKHTIHSVQKYKEKRFKWIIKAMSIGTT